MRGLNFNEFQGALMRHGFAVSGTRIIDVSGRCPGGAWPVVLDSAGKMDRHRTVRQAVKERAAEIARRELIGTMSKPE